jgi:predicted TIM-barrel fold metal-dependent hydrolase
MANIDADAHVLETEQTWSFIAEADKQFTPEIIHHDNFAAKGNAGNVQRESWHIDKRVFPKQKNMGEDTPVAAREMRDIELRLQHMDDLGIDIQVLYPSVFLRPLTSRVGVDFALCNSYNRWLASIWQKSNNRLLWAVVPPLLSPFGKIADELKWAKDNGACSIFLRPLEHDRRSTDPALFELYELAQELDLAIGMHSANGSLTVQEIYRDEFFGFGRVKSLMLAAFHSWIMEGMSQRFPALRIGFIEVGCSWLPYMLGDIRRRHELMDKEFTDNPLGDNRIFVTAEIHEDLAYVVGKLGADNLMVGTDYGHSDVTAQTAALAKLKTECGLLPEAVEKILDANPRAFYGLQ